MTTQLPSKERLEKIASWREKHGAGHNVMLPAEEAESLARFALAAQEPVAQKIYGPYTPTFIGAGVWAGITEELPPELVDREVWITTSPAPSIPVPELTVWYGSMPESNGKSNWTAILHRKGQGKVDGMTIDRSEYPERVLYAADRVRYLIGEKADRPYILDYDADKHSGYVAPVSTPSIPAVPDECPKCDGTGMMDSGGVQSWGEPIQVICDCRYEMSTTAPAVPDAAYSRELFEKWCSANLERNKWHSEFYAHLPAREQWAAWEACRAAMLNGGKS